VALEHRVVTEPSLHAVVADHLSSAGEAHVEAASTHWEQAARHALSVLAYEDAATCYSRAADHCRDDLARNGELLVNEGNAWLLAGDLGQARSRFSAVVTVARVVGDPELFASAVLGIGTGAAGWEVPLASDEYVTLVTEALAFLPADATRMRSMLLARQSVAAATPDTHGPARQRAQEALDLAETIGDPALIGQALAALNDAIAGPGHTISRLQNADTIVEVALAAGDRALELLGYRFRVVADLELGDMAAVDRDIEAFSRLAETIRQPLLSWYVPLFRGMRALLAGDLALADKYHLEVAAAAEATGSHNATMLATTLGLGIDIAAGRPIEPERLEGIADVDPEVWASYAASIAMAHWLAGNHARARELLGLHARNDFARLGDDAEHLTTLTMFGRVASGLGEHAAAEAVYELLLPYSGLWVVDGIAACCWGPTDLELARLALALDRPVEAETHLARAQRSCADAGAVLHAAEVERLADECQARIGHTAPIETDEPPSTDEANRLCREGQFWTLTFRGHTVRMRDAKGLGDLAHLLSSPGREVHVMELAGSAEPGDATGAAVAGAGGDLGELLDARARAEFRRRLAELDDELADAEACADLVRIGNAREEREFLAAELAAALGLGGRPRRAGDPAERARKAVSGRIRMAIGRIDHEHPALARHLTNAVRTGTYCAYEPETTMIWQL
jgi:hypothetical protein